MKISKLQRAIQLLKDLEECTHISACSDRWNAQRADFLLEINLVTTTDKMIILYKQLRKFANSLLKSKLSEEWSFWKRQYWLFMTDPELNVRMSISRLIISMRFLLAEVDPLAFDNLWNNGKKEEWLQESNDLVYPLSRIVFHLELVKNADEMMKLFNYSSFSDYKTQNSQIISDIKTAADKLESSSLNTSIARIAGGGMRIAGGVAGLVVTFAPVTGGLSIIFCVSLGAGGFITTETSKYRQECHDKTTVIKIYEKIVNISPETQAVFELLRSYEVSVEEILQAQSNMSLLSQERGSTLYQRARTTLLSIMPLVPSFVHGVNKINEFVKMMPRSGDVSYQTVAATYLSLQTVYYGINDIVVGAKQIKNGSELVKKIRELSDTLETHTTAYFNTYDEARRSCEPYLDALKPCTPTISSQILHVLGMVRPLISSVGKIIFYSFLSLFILYFFPWGAQEDFPRIIQT